MRKIFDPQHFKMWIPLIVVAVIISIIFHVVSVMAMISGWVGTFIGIIFPFILGFMISYVLNLPRERLESLFGRIKRPAIAKRKRGLSIIATYVLFIVLIIVALVLIIPRIYDGIMDFIAFFPTLMENLNSLLLDLSENEAFPFGDLTGLTDYLDQDAIVDFINPDNIMSALGTIFGLTGTIFMLALALISSVYFSVEAERIKTFVARVLGVLMPSRVFPNFMKYAREINTYFKRYIFCQTLDAVILGTIMTITMTIMGVGYAFVLGPMLGFANLIPYFGSIFGTVIAILVIMLTDGVNMGLIAAVVLIVIQQFDANFVFPRLLGGSMKIPPLLVIIGIVVGNAFYGVLGMVMAIPIVTVVRNIVNDILAHFEAKKAMKTSIVKGLNQAKEVDRNEERDDS